MAAEYHEYYLMNVSRRLRERRYYTEIKIGGRRLIPGARTTFSADELLGSIDEVVQLQNAGAIEVRRVSDGNPVDAVSLCQAVAPKASSKADMAPPPKPPAQPSPPPPPAVPLDEKPKEAPASLGEIFELSESRSGKSPAKASKSAVEKHGRPRRSDED